MLSGHFDCFKIWVITNRATMNIQIPFLCSTSLCISLGSVSLGRICCIIKYEYFR